VYSPNFTYQPAPKILKWKFRLVLPVINETPLFPSDADYNQISSVWESAGIGKLLAD